jgi:hypothetical protein
MKDERRKSFLEKLLISRGIYAVLKFSDRCMENPTPLGLVSYDHGAKSMSNGHGEKQRIDKAQKKQLNNVEARDDESSMKERTYQVIEWEERFWIIDEGISAMEREVTPNLAENEVKIVLLSVQDCPLKVNCIELEGKPGEEVSSICKYLGNYHHLRTTVPCLYNGYDERELFKLLPSPVSLKAKYAKTHFLPGVNPVKKSHAHLVCELGVKS